VPMALPVSSAAAALSSMLPNQPLPLTAAMRVQQPHVITATVTSAATPPRLPQHPLPPQVPVDSAVISTELKRKEAAEALLKQQQQPQILKAREVLALQEDKGEKPQQQQIQFAATQEQIAMLRLQEDPEFRAFYDMFIGRGHPQHLAQSLSLKALQEQRIKRQEGASTAATAVPQTVLEQYAQSVEVFRQQTASPVTLLQQQQQQQPPPAHARPGGIYTATSGRGLPPPDESPYSQAPDAHRLTPVTLQQQQQQQPQQQHATRTSPDYFFEHMKPFPVVWQGLLGLKSESASVQFFYVSGCKDLARNSLPANSEASLPTLRIGQRMRLEETQLEGVRNKMEQAREHCVLLALPAGETQADVDLQSRGLRSNFITYLQLKSAAGIVNVTGAEDGASYVVHVFPACDFANQTMSTIAPELLDKVAEVEHMVIIITTTT